MKLLWNCLLVFCQRAAWWLPCDHMEGVGRGPVWVDDHHSTRDQTDSFLFSLSRQHQSCQQCQHFPSCKPDNTTAWRRSQWVLIWKALQNYTKHELSSSFFEVSENVSLLHGCAYSLQNSKNVYKFVLTGMRAGKLSVTVHSNTSFTVSWKDNLIRNYVCYSVEWMKKGHKAAYMPFYQNEYNNRTLSSVPGL